MGIAAAFDWLGFLSVEKALGQRTERLGLTPERARYLALSCMQGRGPADSGRRTWALSGRVPADWILGDRYRVLRPLGTGGMGQVLLAERLTDQQQVALKLLRSEIPYTRAALARFLREAEILESLEHPGIVRALDVSHVADSEPFLVMEYLEGSTLKQVLETSGTLPWRWAVEAICQVLDALSAAHAQGLVHRDIKPSNCFAVSKGSPLSSMPTLKLIDFGIAKLELDEHPSQSLLTASGQALGTPGYCAPEQAVGSEVDGRADVYSAGATLYELLTGTLPFVGRTSADVAIRQVREQPRPPSAVNPGMGIPEALDHAVLHSLECKVGKRYPSALEMRDTLRAVLEGEASRSTLTSIPAPDPSSLIVSLESSVTGDSGSDEDQLRRLESNVDRFWIRGVLTPSLEGGRLASQRRTFEEQWLQGPTTAHHAIEPPPPTVLSAELPIDTIFSNASGRLLVLGGPGVGKTTALLLIAKAILGSPGHRPKPCPVLFTLSSWDGRAGSLVEWMQEELQDKYRVPRDLAQLWLETNKIIPLCDGLDEVVAAQRAHCVRAINDFLKGHPGASVAVSSRLEEYETLSERLWVDGAVCLHELTESALRDYVARHPAREALTALLRQESMVELARSPLVLGLLSHMVTGGSTEEPGPELNEGSQLGQVLDKYVASMLRRAGKRRLAPGTDLEAQLRRLAWEMRRRSLATFHLEALQPDWLHERTGRWIYAMTTRAVCSALFGLAVVLPYGETPLSNHGFQADLTFGRSLGFWTCIIGTCGAGVLAGLRLASESNWPRRLGYPWRLFLHVATMGTITSTLVGWNLPVAANNMGAQTGALLAPLLYPHAGSGDASRDIRLRTSVAFSLRRAYRALPGALATSAAVGVALALFEDTRSGIVLGLTVCLLWISMSGVRGRRVERVASPNVAVLGSLRTATLRSSLVAGLALLLITVAYGWWYGICVMTFVFLTLWLWYGGYSAIQHGILRALLRLEGATFCVPSVLDAAADRGILHRVGSGYLFFHPLLKTRLADQYEAYLNREKLGKEAR